jgi:hypothetical protein
MAQSNRNAQAKNLSSSGNILAHHLKAFNMIEKNDGVRKYTQRTTTAHDQQCPFQENELTKIAITHRDHNIAHFSDTFLSLKVAFDLQWGNSADAIDDDDHLCQVFFGFKFSGEFLQRVWVYCNGRETGYEQSEEGRQCFCMHQSLDANTVKGQKNTCTAWNDVANFSENVCGIYIPLTRLMDAKQGLTVHMDLVIPMYMLAEFQALEFYPNMLGQLELALYVQSKYAVWAVVDPRKVADVKTFFEDQQIGVRWNNIEGLGGGGIAISRKFAQINNPLNCITEFQIDRENDDIPDYVPSWEAKLTVDSRRLLCTGCRVTEMISNISGFRATQRTLESLRELYRNPWRIPAEYLEYYAFPSPPTGNGLHTSTQVNLHNVKDIYIMFPRQSNDYTVFENPMIDNFLIKVLGQQYPERTYDTLSPRFYQNMIMACDLDGGLKPTKDFIDAYTMRKNHTTEGGKNHG